MLINWDNIYDSVGAKEFIYFISSPAIQDSLFPVKIVFYFFSLFFFGAVIYFYVNSSYIQYQFLQDTSEFLFHEAYGLKKVNKSWKRIKKRVEFGSESELKLAVIEADDFLYETLEDAGYFGDTFEELITNTAKKISLDTAAVLQAHAMRNSIVYEPDYVVDREVVKKVLSVYEDTIKNISIS